MPVVQQRGLNQSATPATASVAMHMQLSMQVVVVSGFMHAALCVVGCCMSAQTQAMQAQARVVLLMQAPRPWQGCYRLHCEQHDIRTC
jgi:hypothetical protein